MGLKKKLQIWHYFLERGRGLSTKGKWAAAFPTTPTGIRIGHPAYMLAGMVW